MCKLVGVTAAAKQSSGNSRKCASCPLVQKLPLRCTPEISRIFNEAHIEGFVKGAKFARGMNTLTEKNLLKIFNQKYGTEIVSRLEKLSEECQELNNAIAGFTMGDNGIAEIKDEMSDVLALITHVCDIAGTNTRQLLFEALDKVKGREKNPDYKRTHPHNETA